MTAETDTQTESQTETQGDAQGESQGTLLGGSAPEPQGESQTAGESDAGQQGTGEQGSTNPLLDMIGDEDLKRDPSLGQVQSVEDLAKSYVHAQKLVGKDKIALPTDENDTEAWNDVLSKLGRPDSPDDYQLPEVSEDSAVKMPEGMDQWFKTKAHELGLTNKQARELWGGYVSEVAEKEVQNLQTHAQQQRQEAEKQLKSEFGNAFQEKLQDAREALKQYDVDGSVAQALDRTGAGNDPGVVKMLAQIGEQFREDKVGGSSKQFSRTPQQAQQEINELKADSNFMQAWMNPSAPNHQNAVEKLRALYEEAYPNG